MKISLEELKARIPGPPTDRWPDGDRYATGFSNGTMSLGYYAPTGSDPQRPHRQDELYIVESGRSRFVLGEETLDLAAGDAVFVPAGVPHRFEDFSTDFGTWVIFWGPEGGESREAGPPRRKE